VKRLQIMIGEDLDAALGIQAVREGVSKAALIRRYTGEGLRRPPPLEVDPLSELVGRGKNGSAHASSRIDEVLYDHVGSPVIFVDASFWVALAMERDRRQFALRRRLALREAFAFDDDFTAAGFVELRA
jgi:hypothetical protein